jgi:hypothetical protein
MLLAGDTFETLVLRWLGYALMTSEDTAVVVESASQRPRAVGHD